MLNHKSNHFVSVAIPAYNEEKVMDACLHALTHQTVSRDHYEIIVVIHEKSTDKTADICKQYKVKYVFEKPGVGRARWRGFKEAKGDILAGTDADTEVAKNWIEVIIDNFKDSAVVAATGPVLTPAGTPLLQHAAFAFGTAIYRAVGKFQKLEVFPGMNYALSRKAYEECGGYDPDILSAEDTDLAYRICKYGKMKYDARMKVFTSTRRLQEGYFHSFFRYSKNFILLKLGKRPPDFPHYR